VTRDLYLVADPYRRNSDSVTEKGASGNQILMDAVDAGNVVNAAGVASAADAESVGVADYLAPRVDVMSEAPDSLD
jgi:hypothetical protein